MGIYAWSNQSGGVHFYRQAEPLRVAKKYGIHTGTGQVLDDAVCAEYDTILVHMLWDKKNSEAWEKLSINNQHRMIFDIDDAMWQPDWEPFKKHYTPPVLKRVFDNIRLAHVVTTPSEYIAEYVQQFNSNVHVVPNTVPSSLLQVKPPKRNKFIIGYQGSPSHLTDINPKLEEDLGKILANYQYWNLQVWGGDPNDVPGHLKDRLTHTPWNNSVTEYYKSLSMDIGIGPLKRTYFNACKSSLRAIEYAAIGVPAVLTDWYPYRGWVHDCATGYLVEEEENWYELLAELIEEPELRTGMGKKAKELARGWTTEANISNWTEAWNSV